MSYRRQIHHCLAAYTAADLNNDNPSNVTVGNIDNGPIYCSIKPTTPVAPSAISNNDAHIIAP